MTPLEMNRRIRVILDEVKQSLTVHSLPSHTKPSIVEATRLIHDHLFDPKLNVDWIRDHCRAPSSTFSQRFKYVHGCTPHVYIRQRRIEAAQRLIETGITDMFRIAMHLGYARYRTFARNFKCVTGCSPTQYRSQTGSTSRDVPVAQNTSPPKSKKDRQAGAGKG